MPAWNNMREFGASFIQCFIVISWKLLERTWCKHQLEDASKYNSIYALAHKCAFRFYISCDHLLLKSFYLQCLWQWNFRIFESNMASLVSHIDILVDLFSFILTDTCSTQLSWGHHGYSIDVLNFDMLCSRKMFCNIVFGKSLTQIHDIGDKIQCLLEVQRYTMYHDVLRYGSQHNVLWNKTESRSVSWLYIIHKQLMANCKIWYKEITYICI